MFLELIFRQIAILTLKQGIFIAFTSVKLQLKYVNRTNSPALYEYSVFYMKIFGASARFNYAWLVSLSNHSDRTLSDTFRKSLREKSNKQQQIKQNILFERFEHILVDFCPQDTNLYLVLRLRSATENSLSNARDAENIKNRHPELRRRVTSFLRFGSTALRLVGERNRTTACRENLQKKRHKIFCTSYIYNNVYA